MANPNYGYQWSPMYGGPSHPNSYGQFQQPNTYKPHPVVESFETADTQDAFKQTFQQRYFGGLKRTLRAFVAVAGIILVVNVSWLLYAKAKYGIVDTYGTISTGYCDTVKQTNIWLHLLINILSTSLLVGSAAFMAAYSSPTRDEINAAHVRRRWVHVGSMSLRNMRWIAKRKTLVVTILALSSAPFHLLYNSLVFMETSVNEYDMIVLGKDTFDENAYKLINDTDVLTVINDYLNSTQTNSGTWEQLDNKACIEAYSSTFISTRRNVLLLSSTVNDTDPVLYSQYAAFELTGDQTSNWWICSLDGNDGGNQQCDPHDYVANATSWEVFGNPIEYCLSQKTRNTCSVKFSMYIMYAMIGFNGLKFLAMLWILLRFNASKILACVGDATASFIQNPDPTTMGMCLADKKTIDSHWQSQGMARLWWGQHRQRWGRAISKKRWAMFLFLISIPFCAILFFGIWGFGHVHDRGYSFTPSDIWSLGFGEPNGNAIIFYDADVGFLGLVMVANSPQIFLAIVWLLYQGIMTAMFIANDWAQFGFNPQTLMVSTPVGKQRGTWLLGAPIWYGLGFLALQTLLHWFISQSIFLIQVTVSSINDDGSNTFTPPTSNAGYSPMAIICSVVMSVVLLISSVWFMLRRFPAGSPPVVSTCSAAISASCHLPHMMSVSIDRKGAVLGKLKWGVTTTINPNGVGHCSLVPDGSPLYLGPPIGGYAYAGIEKRD